MAMAAGAGEGEGEGEAGRRTRRPSSASGSAGAGEILYFSSLQAGAAAGGVSSSSRRVQKDGSGGVVVSIADPALHDCLSAGQSLWGRLGFGSGAVSPQPDAARRVCETLCRPSCPAVAMISQHGLIGGGPPHPPFVAVGSGDRISLMVAEALQWEVSLSQAFGVGCSVEGQLMVCCPDGSALAISCSDGSVAWLSGLTGLSLTPPVPPPRGAGCGIAVLDFTRDCRALMVVRFNGVVEAHSLGGSLIWSAQLGKGLVSCGCVTPAGYLLTAGPDSAHLWRLLPAGVELKSTLPLHYAAVSVNGGPDTSPLSMSSFPCCSTCSPAGDFIVLVYVNGHMDILRLPSLERLPMQPLDLKVASAAWWSAGVILATTLQGETLLVDSQQGTCRAVPSPPILQGPSQVSCFGPGKAALLNGRFLGAGSYGGGPLLWIENLSAEVALTRKIKAGEVEGAYGLAKTYGLHPNVVSKAAWEHCCSSADGPSHTDVSQYLIDISRDEDEWVIGEALERRPSRTDAALSMLAEGLARLKVRERASPAVVKLQENLALVQAYQILSEEMFGLDRIFPHIPLLEFWNTEEGIWGGALRCAFAGCSLGLARLMPFIEPMDMRFRLLDCLPETQSPATYRELLSCVVSDAQTWFVWCARRALELADTGGLLSDSVELCEQVLDLKLPNLQTEGSPPSQRADLMLVRNRLWHLDELVAQGILTPLTRATEWMGLPPEECYFRALDGCSAESLVANAKNIFILMLNPLSSRSLVASDFPTMTHVGQLVSTFFKRRISTRQDDLETTVAMLAAAVEGSKPTLDTEERLLTRAEDLADLVVAAAYSFSRTLNRANIDRLWGMMECLPVSAEWGEGLQARVDGLEEDLIAIDILNRYGVMLAMTTLGEARDRGTRAKLASDLFADLCAAGASGQRGNGTLAQLEMDCADLRARSFRDLQETQVAPLLNAALKARDMSTSRRVLDSFSSRTSGWVVGAILATAKELADSSYVAARECLELLAPSETGLSSDLLVQIDLERRLLTAIELIHEGLGYSVDIRASHMRKTMAVAGPLEVLSSVIEVSPHPFSAIDQLCELGTALGITSVNIPRIGLLISQSLLKRGEIKESVAALSWSLYSGVPDPAAGRRSPTRPQPLAPPPEWSDVEPILRAALDAPAATLGHQAMEKKYNIFSLVLRACKAESIPAVLDLLPAATSKVEDTESRDDNLLKLAKHSLESAEDLGGPLSLLLAVGDQSAAMALVDSLLAQNMTSSEKHPSSHVHAKTTEKGVTAPSEKLISAVMKHGFSRNGASRACIAVRNSGLEPALQWCLDHSSDPDFDYPTSLPTPGAITGAAASVSGRPSGPRGEEALFAVKQALSLLEAVAEQSAPEKACAAIAPSYLVDLDVLVNAANSPSSSLSPRCGGSTTPSLSLGRIPTFLPGTSTVRFQSDAAYRQDVLRRLSSLALSPEANLDALPLALHLAEVTDSGSHALALTALGEAISSAQSAEQVEDIVRHSGSHPQSAWDILLLRPSELLPLLLDGYSGTCGSDLARLELICRLSGELATELSVAAAKALQTRQGLLRRLLKSSPPGLDFKSLIPGQDPLEMPVGEGGREAALRELRSCLDPAHGAAMSKLARRMGGLHPSDVYMVLALRLLCGATGEVASAEGRDTLREEGVENEERHAASSTAFHALAPLLIRLSALDLKSLMDCVCTPSLPRPLLMTTTAPLRPLKLDLRTRRRLLSAALEAGADALAMSQLGHLLDALDLAPLEVRHLVEAAWSAGTFDGALTLLARRGVGAPTLASVAAPLGLSLGASPLQILGVAVAEVYRSVTESLLDKLILMSRDGECDAAATLDCVCTSLGDNDPHSKSARNAVVPLIESFCSTFGGDDSAELTHARSHLLDVIKRTWGAEQPADGAAKGNIPAGPMAASSMALRTAELVKRYFLVRVVPVDCQTWDGRSNLLQSLLQEVEKGQKCVALCEILKVWLEDTIVGSNLAHRQATVRACLALCQWVTSGADEVQRYAELQDVQAPPALTQAVEASLERFGHLREWELILSILRCGGALVVGEIWELNFVALLVELGAPPDIRLRAGLLSVHYSVQSSMAPTVSELSDAMDSDVISSIFFSGAFKDALQLPLFPAKASRFLLNEQQVDPQGSGFFFQSTIYACAAMVCGHKVGAAVALACASARVHPGFRSLQSGLEILRSLLSRAEEIPAQLLWESPLLQDTWLQVLSLALGVVDEVRSSSYS